MRRRGWLPTRRSCSAASHLNSCRCQRREGGGAEEGVLSASHSGPPNHFPTTSQLPSDLDGSLLADLGLSNGDTFTLRVSEAAASAVAAAAPPPAASAMPLAAAPSSVMAAAPQVSVTARAPAAAPPAPTLLQAAPLQTAPQGGGSQAAPVTALGRTVMVRGPRCIRYCLAPPLAASY